jgi:hypothetical protein
LSEASLHFSETPLHFSEALLHSSETPLHFSEASLHFSEHRYTPPKRHSSSLKQQYTYLNLDILKRSLVKAAAEIPLETVRAAIAEWPERLKSCVEVEGGHFEWHYYK